MGLGEQVYEQLQGLLEEYEEYYYDHLFEH
jgi:hypothetical protein